MIDSRALAYPSSWSLVGSMQSMAAAGAPATRYAWAPEHAQAVIR